MEDSSAAGNEEANELERSKVAAQKVCVVSFGFLLWNEYALLWNVQNFYLAYLQVWHV